jgi:hypothetical protein
VQKCKESYATGKYVTQLGANQTFGPGDPRHSRRRRRRKKKLVIDLLIVPIECTVSEMFASCISHKFTLIICIKTLE